MALSDTLRRFFSLEGPLNTGVQTPRIEKRESATLEDFAYAILGNQARREYRLPTVQEALGVPAVLNAVTMISSIVGSLSMEVLRNGITIDPPPIIRRPNPLTTPRDFFRDVAYSMATRGEAWLWIAKRDSDRTPLALVPINPVEIHIDVRDGRRVIRWGQREMSENDLVQITYLREIGAARGVGPLQLAGAAVSVAVESQDWAANFYSQGGFASTLIKHASELDPTIGSDGLNEAQRLLAQWEARQANNVTRVIDQNIESITHHEPNEAGAQMLTSRMYQNGEVANMFGIPGPLLEYSAQGASLTYRNIPDLMRQFVDICLAPRYLEPIEQAMSDLLSRSTVARFDTKGLLRADIKTQMEVAALGLEKGVLNEDESRAIVGYGPNLETQPIPFSPPRALPIARSALQEVRCTSCKRVVGEFAGEYRMRCKKCGTWVAGTAGVIQERSETPADRVADALIALANRETPAPQVTVHTPPITVESPAITVEAPVVNLPANPVELRVETPESQERAAALIEQAEATAKANQQAVSDAFAANVVQLTDVLERKVTEITEAATRPRTFAFERDDNGRITQAKQH